jgi:hypothetical protein
MMIMMVTTTTWQRLRADVASRPVLLSPLHNQRSRDTARARAFINIMPDDDTSPHGSTHPSGFSQTIPSKKEHALHFPASIGTRLFVKISSSPSQHRQKIAAQLGTLSRRNGQRSSLQGPTSLRRQGRTRSGYLRCVFFYLKR